MIIGKFTSNGNGYSGSIQSVGLDLADVTITPVPAKQGNGPDLVVVSTAKHDIEIGAAWKKTSKAGKAYLSVKLDGPTLAAPINCALTQQQDGTHALVWNRREADEEQAAA
jgi:uncharacterized protein (DUF736 family)